MVTQLTKNQEDSYDSRFSDDCHQENIPMITAVTVIDLPNHTLVLSKPVSDFVYLTIIIHLFCFNQMREHGVEVNNDKAKKAQ